MNNIAIGSFEPMPPVLGPPLPRFLGLIWPWGTKPIIIGEPKERVVPVERIEPIIPEAEIPHPPVTTTATPEEMLAIVTAKPVPSSEPPYDYASDIQAATTLQELATAAARAYAAYPDPYHTADRILIANYVEGKEQALRFTALQARIAAAETEAELEAYGAEAEQIFLVGWRDIVTYNRYAAMISERREALGL